MRTLLLLICVCIFFKATNAQDASTNKLLQFEKPIINFMFMKSFDMNRSDISEKKSFKIKNISTTTAIKIVANKMSFDNNQMSISIDNESVGKIIKPGETVNINMNFIYIKQANSKKTYVFPIIYNSDYDTKNGMQQVTIEISFGGDMKQRSSNSGDAK